MKKIKILFFAAITFILIFSISYAEDNTPGQPRIKKSAEKKVQPTETVQGRVIFLNNESIEIKKGSTEITLYFKDGAIFVNKTGEEKTIEIIKLCQNVKALYTREGDKNILQKIIVLKDSNCIKK